VEIFTRPPSGESRQAMEKPIDSIITEFQQGRDSQRNFQLLFERFYDRVWRFFQRKGFSPEDSEELTQEVFLSVYKGLTELRGPEQFQSWLFAVARNTYVNELERLHARKREGVQVSLEEEVGEGEDLTLAERLPAGPGSIPIETILDRERIETLHEAMMQLPEQMRRCVQFRVLQDASYQEIATVMEISINTVKAHLFKARETLRERLRPYFAEVDF